VARLRLVFFEVNSPDTGGDTGASCLYVGSLKSLCLRRKIHRFNTGSDMGNDTGASCPYVSMLNSLEFSMKIIVCLMSSIRGPIRAGHARMVAR
jgi:hypothetical protein